MDRCRIRTSGRHFTFYTKGKFIKKFINSE